MLTAVHLPDRFTTPLSDLKDNFHSSPLYKLSCRIFQQIIMAVQYAAVGLIATFGHWIWISSAIPTKFLTVSSCNIASLKVLMKCLKTVNQPIPKSTFDCIGRPQGLRVTHDLTYRPASGLCIGICLSFISKILLAKNSEYASNALKEAKALKYGSNEESVKIQALYDALIGMNGVVQPNALDSLCPLLLKKTLSAHPESLLSLQIKAFLNCENQSQTLRHFVLNNLEKQGIDINPDLYTLILELDAQWSLQQFPLQKKYDVIHSDIIKALCNYLKITFINSEYSQDQTDKIGIKLKNLVQGSYLLQFTNHTLALIKTHNQIILLDPNEGLAIQPKENESELHSSLLKYYGSNDWVGLKIISILK